MFVKTFSLSIKKHYLTDDYIPKFSKYDYVRELDFENIDDMHSLHEIVNCHVHTYYTYRDNVRNTNSFHKASAIFLDFDGKGEHNDSTIEEFKSSEFGRKYNWVLYSSKSHKPNIQDCFHVILPLDEHIVDLGSLSSTYKRIFEELNHNGLRCDYKVHDGARLIFPSYNMDRDEQEHIANFHFDFKTTGMYITPETASFKISEVSHVIKSTKSTKRTFAVVPKNDIDDENDEAFQDVDESSPFVKQFLRMSKNSQYKYFLSMMKFSNRYNRQNDFSPIGYNLWIAYGFMLRRIFGYKKGLSLFQTLSAGHPNDTEASIQEKYDTLNSCTEHVDTMLSKFISWTCSCGFKHLMYFKFYFMSKHSLSPTKAFEQFRKLTRKLLDKLYLHNINVEDAKIYDFSHLKYTRIFLLVIHTKEDHIHIPIRLSNLIDMLAEMYDIDRMFVTTTLTHGIIRSHVNMNGVIDLYHHIQMRISKKMAECNDEYIRVEDVHAIIKEIRGYAPKTKHVRNDLSFKHVESILSKRGVIIEKKKKRFKVDDVSTPYMAYAIDRAKIDVTYTTVLVQKTQFGYSVTKEQPKSQWLVMQRRNNIMLFPQRTEVMTC